jgi:TetR/AcrR family transcriptional regulator
MSAAHDRPEDAPKAPRMRKAERRKQLLAVAAHRFATAGFATTSMAQIAEAAGVTEALLARYFDSKEAMLLAILAEVRVVSLDRWESELAALGDPVAKLHAVADLFLRTVNDYSLAFQLIHRLLIDGTDDKVMGVLRAFYLDVEALLAGIIAEGQQAGVFRRSLDPRVGAWQMIQTAVGYKMTQPLAAPVFAELDYLSRAIDCLLDCLLKTDV